MFYVYILKSLSFKDKYYTGFTRDLKKRLIKHNNGEVPHTSKFKPWDITAYFAFNTQDKATAFERYLKTHSGRAFAKKHF
jgi:predicted GIY-YIG superfamily endonuclease